MSWLIRAASDDNHLDRLENPDNHARLQWALQACACGHSLGDYHLPALYKEPGFFYSVAKEALLSKAARTKCSALSQGPSSAIRCECKGFLGNEAPLSPDEVPSGEPDAKRDQLLDEMMGHPEGSPERERARERLRSFGRLRVAGEGFEYYEDETGGHISRPKSVWRHKTYTLVRPVQATAVESGLPLVLEAGDSLTPLGKENDPQLIVKNWEQIEAIAPGDTIRLGFQDGNRDKLMLGDPPRYEGLFLANAQEFFDAVAEVDSLPPAIGMLRLADVASRAPILVKQFPGFFHENDIPGAVKWLEQFADKADPTGRLGKYTPWLIKQIRENSWPAPDKYDEAKELLATFDKIKNKKGFPADKRDINRLQWGEVNGLVEDFKDLQSLQERVKAGIEVVHDADGVRITEISTPEAAQELCRDTGWCVVNPNTARSYMREGPLVKIDVDGEPWALWSANGSLEGPSNSLVDEEPVHDVRKAVQQVYGGLGEFNEALRDHKEQHTEDEDNRDDQERYFDGDIPFEDLDAHDMVEVLEREDEQGTEQDETWRGRVETLIQRGVQQAIDYLSALEEPGRWPSLERAVLDSQSPSWAVSYAQEVMRQRWPQAEHIIYRDEDAAKLYEWGTAGPPKPGAEPDGYGRGSGGFGTLVPPYRQPIPEPEHRPHDSEVFKPEQKDLPVGKGDTVTLSRELTITRPRQIPRLLNPGDVVEVMWSDYASSGGVNVRLQGEENWFVAVSKDLMAAVQPVADAKCLNCGEAAEDHPYAGGGVECAEPRMTIARRSAWLRRE